MVSRRSQPVSITPMRIRVRGALCLLGFGVAAATWSCTDSTNPSLADFRDPASVSALVLDSAAPPLASDSATVWAVKGQDRSLDIFFADSAGIPGPRLLHFEVSGSSLDRYPDGSKFKNGDSVLISVRVADPGALSFAFEPSGLKFKASHPAELVINYGRAVASVTPAPPGDQHGDHHGGGHQDETALSIWVQEQASNPYKKITSTVDTTAREISGGVPGFSKYAVAY